MRMSRIGVASLMVAAMLCGSVVPLQAAEKKPAKMHREGRPFRIYLIDVEGGHAALYVAPSGESLLIDTGWASTGNADSGADLGVNKDKSVDRILMACKDADVTKIDSVLITHYHSDHISGVFELAKRIPIGRFIDHGPNREHNASNDPNYANYIKLVTTSNAEHLVPHVGDVLPIFPRAKRMEVRVVSGDTHVLTTPLQGAGQDNSVACKATPEVKIDPSENADSLGVVMRYGQFRVADLGDLTKEREVAMMCPVNRLGHVDVFVVSHHGLDLSNSPALVHGLAPRVAIMGDGSTKGDQPLAFATITSSPGLEDLWEVHYNVVRGDAGNVKPARIANLQGPDEGNPLIVDGYGDGSFEVTNPRTKETVAYPVKK